MSAQVGTHSPAARAALAAVLAALLVLVVVLSLSLGSNSMGFATTWRLLLAPDGSTNATVLHELRLPRTILGILVGAALALAGALMQSLTRNPLADPGILGINAGASFAVVLAVALGGWTSIHAYVWFAFVGAALAALGVHLLGQAGHTRSTPARLALAGIALSAALGALTQTTILANQHAFNEFRFWVAGSLEGRGWTVSATVGIFMAVGAVLGLALGPALNALALGDEAGRSLGVNVARTRGLTMLAVTLLCGAATAAAGPLTFVGLAVPFVIRALVGPDQRWIGILSLVAGPVWLLGADVLARVLVAPQEVPVGIVSALVGAPFFVWLVRRREVIAL